MSNDPRPFDRCPRCDGRGVVNRYGNRLRPHDVDVRECEKCHGTVPVSSAHECILAVIGSTYEYASPETVTRVKAAIIAAFDRHDPRGFVSGGAHGVDSWAAEEAYRRGMTDADVREHLPKHRRWAPDGFKDRDELIVRDCEHLVRIYDPESKTYGSGWTADLAERLGKSVERIAVPR